MSVGAVSVLVLAGAACDAVLGIPGDLRDRAEDGALREGRFSTLASGPVSAKTTGGDTLWLTGAELERRAPEDATMGCASGLCLRGSLSARGGGQ